MAPPRNLWVGNGIGVSENEMWGTRKRVNVSRKMGKIIR